MTISEKIINSILKDLTNVRENLLSLSEDIWSSIDCNDVQKRNDGIEFMITYNNLLKGFEDNSFDITVLLSQFAGVQTFKVPKIEDVEVQENQRLIIDLDREVPHLITENFTYKRPFAFILEGVAYRGISTWTDLYITFLTTLSHKNKQKLLNLAGNTSYFSNQGKEYYSTSPDKLRIAKCICENFYVETNLSALEIARRIREILDYFSIDVSELKIFLSQDRNA